MQHNFSNRQSNVIMHLSDRHPPALKRAGVVEGLPVPTDVAETPHVCIHSCLPSWVLWSCIYACWTQHVMTDVFGDELTSSIARAVFSFYLLYNIGRQRRTRMYDVLFRVFGLYANFVVRSCASQVSHVVPFLLPFPPWPPVKFPTARRATSATVSLLKRTSWRG
jgi:hypothetical protein